MARLAQKLRSPLLTAGALAALLCAAAPQAAVEATTRPASLTAVGAAAAPTQPVGLRDTRSAWQRARPRQQRDRFCTPYGCGLRSGSPMSSAAGFAVAVVGAVWLSRRRGGAHPPR